MLAPRNIDARRIRHARITSVGMDIRTSAVRQAQRQFFEKAPLREPEFAAGPLHRNLGLNVQVLARIPDRVIMVAEHGEAAGWAQSMTTETVHSGSAP